MLVCVGLLSTEKDMRRRATKYTPSNHHIANSRDRFLEQKLDLRC